MLDAGAAVEIDVLLDLRFAHAVGWLVDGHLDLFVEVDHDDGAEGGVVGVDLFVIDGPEPMEVQHLFVPLSNRLHLAIRLVSDTMVDRTQINGREKRVQFLFQVVGLEAGEEESLVLTSLHERVNRVTVSLNRCENDRTELIFEFFRLSDRSRTSRDALFIDSRSIVNGERDILDTVTVLGVMFLEFWAGCGVDCSLEDIHDIVVADNMAGKIAVASLKTLYLSVSEIIF